MKILYKLFGTFMLFLAANTFENWLSLGKVIAKI